MGRIRTIKPEFWQDEELSQLPAAVHILAAALLNYADDYGYFNANPGLVKGGAVPLRRDVPEQKIPRMLADLEKIGYIVLGMTTEGKTYGFIVKFDKHQRVSHPTESRIKPLEILWNSPEIFWRPPELLVPEQGTGNREVGKEGEEPRKASSSPGANGEFIAATALLQDCEIPATANDIRIAAQVIQIEAKHHGGVEGAMDYLKRQISESRNRGEVVTVFWLKDRKYLMSARNGTRAEAEARWEAFKSQGDSDEAA